MIRILHSVSNMDRAGIETMLMNYYRHIDREKIQFDFLCNKKKPGAYDDEIIKMGGRIFHSPGLNPIKYFEYMKFIKKLISEYPEYKIVHAHNGAFGVYSLHGAKLAGVPIRIFHAHGASITKDWKLPLKLICKSRLNSNMNQHWSCGIESAKCYFGEKTVRNNDYLLIHNAIELDRFVFNMKVRADMRSKHKLEDKIVIGHVGRFMVQKNHKKLLEVFGEIHRLEQYAVLVLLGDGELEDEIKNYADKLGIRNYVMFMGNVSNVNEWYQAFDVFVLPSIWEGLPVVGIEAQTADLPCVFSSGITRETAITENASFVALDEENHVWADIILDKAKKASRVDRTADIRKAGYDIELEAKKMQDKYLELLKEL
ncbi:MAG: glycosyltransferase family 1 protein [bacterium]|nr:glycosyltransferase family 1 protein [bacterium]